MAGEEILLGHFRMGGGGPQASIDVLRQLLAIRGKDSEKLTVLEVSHELRHQVRRQMNRHMLLGECRKAVPNHVPVDARAAADRDEEGSSRAAKQDPPLRSTRVAEGHGHHPGRRKSVEGAKSSGRSGNPLFGNRSSMLNRGASATPLGLPIQLRDIRCLLSLSEPALLVRRGAMVVSFGAVRGVITAERAFFLVPAEEAEADDQAIVDRSSLAQLLNKLREEPLDKQVRLPFELVVLEGVLVASSELYMHLVNRCSDRSRVVLRQLRRNITPELLNQVYVLKGSVANVLQQVSGAKEVLERLQKDDTQMPLMNLTQLAEDAPAYDRLLLARRCYTEHVEVLLDSYVLEVESLETKLILINKQIDATEDLLRLRLEGIQKNTFIANAIFHMFLTLIAIPTCVSALWGSNLWSGYKFHLAGPDSPGINYKPPDYPTTQYDEDPHLGVSWVFLYNSVGVILAVLVLTCCMLCYVRHQGLHKIRVLD